MAFFITNAFSQQFLGSSLSPATSDLKFSYNLDLGTNTGAKSRIHLHHPYPDGITPVALPIFVQFTNKHTTDGASNGFKVGISLLTQKDAYINQQEDANMYFLTNNQTQVTITNIGRVGVGITAPNYTMHLHSLDEVPGGSKPPGGFSSIGIDPSVVSPASTRGVNMQGYNALQITNTTTDLQPSDGLLIGTIGNTSFINQQENADLDFYTHNIKRLVITKYGVFKFNTISENAQVNIQSQTKNGMFIRTIDPNINYGLAIVSNNNVNAILVNNEDKFIVKGDGRVGIGVANPTEKLEVIGNTNISGNVGIGITNPTEKLTVSGNTKNIEISNTAETEAGLILNDAQGASSQYAKILFNSSNNNLSFYVNNSSETRMVIKSNGNVGIGGVANPQYKLDIKGTARACKIIAKDPGGWCDYVFNDNYKLPKLTEVEDYIKTNKHLPEIPSEDDVMQNGIDLAKMDSQLLKKIEELTLYIIEQNKAIKDLQKQIDELKNK